MTVGGTPTDMAAPFTARLLGEAGIAPGMRVLDVGCGRGDVSLALARLVGAAGSVLGIDRDAGALEVARDRAAGLEGVVSFARIDLADLAGLRGPFDAVVGRRVLMYLPDKAGVLAGLVRLLRPGGIAAFQEHDATACPARLVPLPLHERVQGWMWRTVEAEGADIHTGFRLAGLLAGAGLAQVEVRAEAIVQTPDAAHHTGTIMRAMVGRIVSAGVATAAEIDVDTLDARLAAERRAARATFIGELIFGGWARKPG